MARAVIRANNSLVSTGGKRRLQLAIVIIGALNIVLTSAVLLKLYGII